MADKPSPPISPLPHSAPGTPSSEARPSGSDAPTATSASRSGNHRSLDARDAMAEMAERAQIISQEAGTKIAAAMKEVIGAAAGIAGFAVESARDLVQYMVRRGQMTQDEADKLIREAEEAHTRRAGRTKSETVSEAARREPVKQTAHASGKKSAPSAGGAKAEKKPEAKRAPAPKKTTAKQATSKKRR